MFSKEISTLASTISLRDMRVWRAEGCKLAPSVKKKKYNGAKHHQRALCDRTVFGTKKKAGAHGEATHARTTGASTKQKKRVSNNGRTKIVVRASQFSNVPTLLHSGLKRGLLPLYVCCFVKKTFFTFTTTTETVDS